MNSVAVNGVRIEISIELHGEIKRLDRAERYREEKEAQHIRYDEYPQGVDAVQKSFEKDIVGKIVARIETHTELYRAIEKLRPLHKRIITLIYLLDIPPRSAATMLSISTRTLYRKRKQALNDLAQNLRGDNKCL